MPAFAWYREDFSSKLLIYLGICSTTKKFAIGLLRRGHRLSLDYFGKLITISKDSADPGCLITGHKSLKKQFNKDSVSK